MTFKRGLYVISPSSYKLNKKKYDYATLVEFFDLVDDLTYWDNKTIRNGFEWDDGQMTEQKNKAVALHFLLHNGTT